jgi:RHS repeat-associated protein
MTQKSTITTVCAKLNMILAVVICLAFASQSNVKAQSNIALQGTEAPSVTDGVDVFSGQLEQILPLLSIGGRGEINKGLYLPLRNSQWSIMETASVINNDKVYKYFTALQGNASTNFVRPGYSTLGKLELELKHTSLMMWETYTVSEIRFTSNKGSIIRFRDVLTNGQPYAGRSRGCIISAPLTDPSPTCSRGRVFRAVDGSNATLVTDNDVYDLLYMDWGSPANPSQYQNLLTGTVYLSDGTRIRFENYANNITKITDRNGNYMTFEYETGLNDQFNFLKKITDSLNREITIIYGDSTQTSYFDDIVYKGFGQAERRIRIHYVPVETTMLPGQSLGVPLFPGVRERCYYLSSGSPCPVPTPPPGSGYYATSLKVVSAIVLPNNQEYRFYYNNYLEVARIKFPTGAYTDYSFGGLTGAGPDGFTEPLFSGGGTIYRRITGLKSFDESGGLIAEKTFSNIPEFVWATSTTIDNVVIDVKDSGGTVISKTKHYFYDLFQFQGMYTVLPMRYGKEYKTEILDPVSSAVLRRTETTWSQREPFQWCNPTDPFGFYTCDNSIDPNAGPPVDPRVTEVKTTLENGQVTKRTLTYDQYNNVADAYEYDWGTSQPGALLRRTHTTYVTDPNYTNYTNGRTLLRLPDETWVSSDLNGSNKTSFTEYEFDNYSTNSPHAALVPRSNVSGHDTGNYHAGFTVRGNLTAVTSFADAQAQTGPIVAYSQFDVLGNRVKTIDPKGFITTVDYSDHFGTPSAEARGNWDTVSAPAQLSGKSTFAFVTSVTNPANQVVFTQYDYSTGQIVDAEDMNGNVSSSFYDDPIDRLTQVIIANNRTTFRSQQTTDYDDVNRKTTVTSDLFVFGDDLTKSETLYNSMGQTTETRTFEAGGYIVVKREYDAMGRVIKVSNPHRPYLNQTPVWTTTEYDSLNRVKKVKATDNTEINTSYTGNATTVTDQGGKSRRSIRNSVGQLTRIDEPNSLNDLGNIDTPTQPTDYNYSANGQLVKVTQGGQSRYFLFDSIGRLIRVRQPEQDANASLALADPITGNSAWSSGSTYDSNGNPLTTTDAKGVVITQSYDALNRVLTRSYSNTTPTVSYTYDDPNINYSKGRLTKVSSSVSVTEHTDFDPLGRILSHKQTTDGQVYTTGYSYTLIGALFEETYPSGRIVRSTTNTDGRLSDVSSKKIGQTNFQSHADNFAYSPHGAVSQMRLGNGNWESMQFNIRLQPSQVALGTSAGASDVFNTSYEYGEIDTGGNFLANKNNGNLARQTISFSGLSQPFVQTYKYDPVNRLKEAKEMNGASQTWIQTLDYDRYGNRTSFNQQKVGEQSITQTPSVSTASNRITTGQGFVYDFNGNVTQDNQNRQFTFDGNNNQTEVKDSANNVIGTYYYDGNGRRVKKVTASEITVFVYDAVGLMVAEYSSQIVANPGLNYVTSDNVGSPRVITDAAGSVVTRRDFMPFGEELMAGTANRTTTHKYGSGIDKLRKRFTGYQRDSETNLDFAEARYYDNRYGRFTTIDPLLASGKSANPQSFNRYAYVMNNPGVLVDPTGSYPDNYWYTVDGTSMFDEPRSVRYPIPLVWWTETIGPMRVPPKSEEEEEGEARSHNTTILHEAQHGDLEEDQQTQQPAASELGHELTDIPDQVLKVFNCGATSFGFTDRWIQAGGEYGVPGWGVTIIDKNGNASTMEGTGNKWVTAETLPTYFGGKKTTADAALPPDRYRLVVFEDRKQPKLWHIMYQDPQTGSWVSKNGESSMYVGITNPTAFYKHHYSPQEIKVTYYSMPGKLMAPRVK